MKLSWATPTLGHGALIKAAVVAATVVSLFIAAPGRFATQTSAFVSCDVPISQVSPLDTEETKFLQLINDYRAQNGVGPLSLSYSLSRSAQWKTNDLVANRYFDHNDLFLNPIRGWNQRIYDCGYSYNVMRGENLALAYQTAQNALDTWKTSSGHNLNMLNSSWKAIGIGRTYDAKSGWDYWATDFAQYADSATYLPQLPNDDFANATIIAAAPFTDGPIDVTETAIATTEAGETQPCGAFGNSTVWYRFTSSRDVTLKADTFGSDYDTTLAVYTGSTLAGLSQIACNDDSGSLQSLIQFPATWGVTYYFQADAFDYNGNDATGIHPRHLVFNLSAADGSTVQAVASATPTASPTPLPTATPQPTATPPAVDAVSPSVSIVQPVAGVTVPRGKTVTLAASASDNVGVTKVEFYVNGARKCRDTSAPYSCGWGVPNTSGVTYTLEARAYDGAGHTASQSITVVSGVDSTPPTVSFTGLSSSGSLSIHTAVSLSGGGIVPVNTTQLMNASAADGVGVAKVDFFVNGSRKCSDKVAPFTCSWAVPGTPGVTYTLVAKAYDAAGNTASSAPITVTSQ